MTTRPRPAGLTPFLIWLALFYTGWAVIVFTGNHASQ